MCTHSMWWLIMSGQDQNCEYKPLPTKALAPRRHWEMVNQLLKMSWGFCSTPLQGLDPAGSLQAQNRGWWATCCLALFCLVQASPRRGDEGSIGIEERLLWASGKESLSLEVQIISREFLSLKALYESSAALRPTSQPHLLVTASPHKIKSWATISDYCVTVTVKLVTILIAI